MDSMLDRMVKEDCLEEAALSRGLNVVTEQLGKTLRRKAFQVKGTPSAESLRQKNKTKQNKCHLFTSPTGTAP